MVDLTTPPLPDLSTPAVTDWFLTWRGTSPFRLTLDYMPVKNADGQWLFDKANAAGGASASAIRLTQNAGAGGGYFTGSNTETLWHNNSEYITGTGLVARATSATMIRQTGGNIEFYGNAGLTSGSAFSPTLRCTINGTSGLITTPGALTVGGNLGVGTASPFCQFHISASVAGAPPATSGTTDANVIARMQGGSVGLDVGVRPSGVMWIQPRSVGNLATNFGLDICPNGGVTDIYGQANIRGTLFVGAAQQGLVQHDGTHMHIRPQNASSVIYLGAAGSSVAVVQAGTFYPNTDNNTTLGVGSLRWSIVYSATGTINTSDQREKHWRGALNVAELQAAKRIAAEIGVYQWLDAVAEKGDAARLHVGIRAQRAFAILEQCGLDWRRYAWCCYDKWDDMFEDTFEEVITLVEGMDGSTIQQKDMVNTGKKRLTNPAGDRYGVRPDQLAMFLIAAQEQRLMALEAFMNGE